MHRLGGLARQVAYIKKQRSLGPSLVINGGAAFFPPKDIPLESPALNEPVQNAQVVAQALKLQKIDVYTPAPQDFAQGRNSFAQLAKIAELPLLSSNLIDNKTHKPAYKTFIRLQRGAVPMLVIALQDPKTWPKDTGLKASDPVLSAQSILAQHAQPGDVVILIANSDMDRAQGWSQNLPELSAVLVAQRSMLSFFPREFVRPKDKGKIDGSNLPLISAGHSGEQLIQLDIFYQPGDSLLRGGAIFEDAREQIQAAQYELQHKAKNLVAIEQIKNAQKTLDRQKGLTHYRYRYVEMSMHRPEDPRVKKIIRTQRDKATNNSK